MSLLGQWVYRGLTQQPCLAPKYQKWFMSSTKACSLASRKSLQNNRFRIELTSLTPVQVWFLAVRRERPALVDTSSLSLYGQPSFIVQWLDGHGTRVVGQGSAEQWTSQEGVLSMSALGHPLQPCRFSTNVKQGDGKPRSTSKVEQSTLSLATGNSGRGS